MRYSVDKLAGIDLGRQGENLARTVEIDVSALLSRWPEAVISLLVKRKQDAEPYIADAHVVDGVLYWPITAADTASAGDGKVELRAVCGEVLAKSTTGSTRVTASLTGNETEPPEAAQGWVDRVIAAGGDAQVSAEAAREAATEAKASAESAEVSKAEALSARDEAESFAVGARTAAERADESAKSAAASASAAKESEINSKAAEDAAGISARETKASEEQAKAAEISAQGSAERAETARQKAEEAAADAHTDSESAKASEAAALNARNEAETFAADARTSAEAAKSSAEAAAGSASAAQESEINVKTSEEVAATSAREAKASEEQAKASETAARESAEQAETARQKAEEAAAAAYTDSESAKASEAAALNARNEAEEFSSGAHASAEAAKNSEKQAVVAASAAQASETNAKVSENAAAVSEKNVRTAEANAKASADAALAAQEKAEASERIASEAAERAQTAAQKAETAVETAADEVRAGLLNDGQIAFTSAWSSRQTVERLCPEVEASGNPVQLPDLLGGHPLSVKHSFTPIQHFDWMKRDAATTQRTTTGAQLLDISKATVNGPHYGLNIRIEGEWMKIDGTANVKATGRYSFAILNVGQPELQGKGYAVACFGDGRIEGSYGLRNESESAVAVYATLSPDTAFSAAFQVMISAEAAGAMGTLYRRSGRACARVSAAPCGQPPGRRILRPLHCAGGRLLEALAGRAAGQRGRVCRRTGDRRLYRAVPRRAPDGRDRAGRDGGLVHRWKTAGGRLGLVLPEQCQDCGRAGRQRDAAALRSLFGQQHLQQYGQYGCGHYMAAGPRALGRGGNDRRLAGAIGRVPHDHPLCAGAGDNHGGTGGAQ